MNATATDNHAAACGAACMPDDPSYSGRCPCVCHDTKTTANALVAACIMADYGQVHWTPQGGPNMAYVVAANGVRILSRTTEYGIRFEVGVLDPTDEMGDLQRIWATAEVTGPDTDGSHYGVKTAMVNWPSLGQQKAVDAESFARILTVAAALAVAVDAAK